MKYVAVILVVLFSHFMPGASQDEVFIHTDRDIYQSGEVMKFKAYFLSPEGKECQSEWLRIYLIDQRGTSHFEGRFEINDCAIIGDIALPGSLEEGSYTFLAFCEGTVVELGFTKSILIRDTNIPGILISIGFDKKPYRVGEEVIFYIKLLSPKGEIVKRFGFQYCVKVNGSQVVEGKGKTNKLGSDEIVISYPDCDDNSLLSFEISLEQNGSIYTNGVIVPSLSKPLLVSFFPEGGLLIDGHKSNIGFTAFDHFGCPVNIQGNLVDQYNEIRGSIETSVPGLGAFSLMADAGTPLKLRITEPIWAQSIIDLPRVQSNGVVLRLLSRESDKIHLELINPIEDTYMQLRVEAFQGKEELLNSRLLLTTQKDFFVPLTGSESGIVRINILGGADDVMAQRCVYLGHEALQAAGSEGSMSVVDSYLSPEWNSGPSLKQVSILGIETALSPFVDMLIDDKNLPIAELLEAYMLTCIREPEKLIKEDSSAIDYLRIVQEKYRFSQIDQYISELSVMQFVNNHFMSEESGFSEFFINNKTELDRLGLNPQKLSPDERIRRQLDNGKSVLSIIMSIRAYRLVNNQMVFRGSDSFKYQGGAIIVIDGIPKGSDVAEIKNISPYEVASIKVSTNISEVMKYSGMENTAGVVIIETKKVSDAVLENTLGSSISFSSTALWNPHYTSRPDNEEAIVLPETKLKSKYWKRIVIPFL
ncbi:MAG: hypothetical protein KAH17_08605 [Bacteroidales bacterium]|nr:hypothetical protein [Bacteroidales bacterium]